MFSHLIIVVIGILSGFEVPLLIALGEQTRPGSTNRVLAIDYIGSLFASVLFPLWMVRHLGLLASGVAVGLVNALVLLLILILWRTHTGIRLLLPALATFTALVLIALNAHPLEQHFLHKLYFEGVDGWFFELFKPRSGPSRVEHYRSTYQRIDLIHVTHDGFLAIDAPGSWCGELKNLWPIYYSTLRAAGFATVLPYITQFDLNAPRLQRYLRNADNQYKDEETEEAEMKLRERIINILPELPIQEFILAFVDKRSISRRYRDMGERALAFDEHHYRLAFQSACVDDKEFSREQVNSIARPTLPPLQLISMALP